MKKRAAAPTSIASAVAALEAAKSEFGPGCAERKLALVAALERASFDAPSRLRAYHESLLFLLAYPDDPRIRAAADAALSRFGRRADLKRHAAALADSGLAGTSIQYPFYFATARRLTEQHPGAVRVDWAQFENFALLERYLPLFALYAETPGLDEAPFEAREWIEGMKSPRETDAEFLIRRFQALAVPEEVRERLYDELELPLLVQAGEGTPSRSLERAPRSRVRYQRRALERSRPDLKAEILRPPESIREVRGVAAQRLVRLAQDAMTTRSRDLDAFMHADARDVRLVDAGDGLAFAVLGVKPARRLLLEAVYGFLSLRNGVPIGYVLTSALLHSAEIAYNVFDTYRGAEAAHVYARALAAVRALFAVDSFTVYPYQLGHDNEEGLKSGAWWFYEKLGFHARDRATRLRARAETAKVGRDRAYRTSEETLQQLSAANVYFDLGTTRPDVIGTLPLWRVGLELTDLLAARFGADREAAEAEGLRIADSLVRGNTRLERARSAGERLALRRWAPLLLLLPDLERWSSEERLRLHQVLRAKGGRRESDFVRLFDRHDRLREAISRLAGYSRTSRRETDSPGRESRKK